MKVKNIYRKLENAVEDSFEAKVEYCKARKDLTMISHMVNEYHDEYVFEGADGYVTVHNALKSNFIRYGYGWDNKARILTKDGRFLTVTKELYKG